MKFAPSSVSLFSSVSPALNFVSNSCCHVRNVSPHASIVYS